MVNENGEEISIFKRFLAKWALIMSMKAFPAEYLIFYQWRCPHGGTTGWLACILQE